MRTAAAWSFPCGGCFFVGRRLRCCSNPPAIMSLMFMQKKTASVSLHQRFFHGRGWIRTTEAEKQQIYSLSPLATREHAHILFVSVAGRLVYFIIGFWICQPLFFISFSFFVNTMIHIFMHASQKPPSEKSYSFIKFCNIVNILYFFGGQASGRSATIVFVLSLPLAGGGSFTHKQEELSCSKKSFT